MLKREAKQERKLEALLVPLVHSYTEHTFSRPEYDDTVVVFSAIHGMYRIQLRSSVAHEKEENEHFVTAVTTTNNTKYV